MKHLLLILALIGTAGCGSNAEPPPPATPDPANPAGLTAEQLEHGVGPVSAFDPGPFDAALADRGEALFTMKCSSCHKMDARYVGPALGTITKERSPAYIMNMILNPQEMITVHPEAKKRFTEFLTPMPNQSLSEDEARAVLEYLRKK